MRKRSNKYSISSALIEPKLEFTKVSTDICISWGQKSFGGRRLNKRQFCEQEQQNEFFNKSIPEVQNYEGVTRWTTEYTT